jgi:hypothetical protein
MDPAHDELTEAEEAEFAALPDALKLALFDLARGQFPRVASPREVPARIIAEATDIPLSRVTRTLSIAMLKLEREATAGDPDFD